MLIGGASHEQPVLVSDACRALHTRSARAQVTQCEWVCFEREGEGSVGAKGGDFAPQSAHTQFSGSRWSLRSSASAFASDILRSASAQIWGRGEIGTPAHQLEIN